MAREDFPGTYYAHTYEEAEREGGGYDPVVGAPKPYTETLTGEGYQLDFHYKIDVDEIPNFDEATQTPAKLFEMMPGVGPGDELEYKLNRIYYMTPTELAQLSGHSVYDENNGFIGVGRFLVKILRLPFEIDPSEYSTRKRDVIYDNEAISLTAYRVAKETVLVNFGSISVPEIHGNSRDYEDASYYLRLPFVSDEVELNASDIVGKAVSVRVAFDVYSGDATALVYADGRSTPISSAIGRIGRSVPFATIQQSYSDAQGFRESYSEFMTPYIEARLPETVEGDYANMIEKVGTLASVSGFVSVSGSNVALPGATESERREIETLLEDGVYIK